MPATRWKSFEENPVTHSVAHHLMAIDTLKTEQGYARVTDVARRLGITRGSVSLTLKALKKKGLVIEDDNRFVGLSEQGRDLVRALRAKQGIVRDFLGRVLGLPEETAATDACKIEHLVSNEAAARMLRFTRIFGATSAAAEGFRQAWDQARGTCEGQLERCATCKEACLDQLLVADREDRKKAT